MKTIGEIKNEIKLSLSKTEKGSIGKEDIFNPMLDMIEVFDHEFNKLRSATLFGGIEYVDLDLPSGNLWASSNLGSDCELELGQYFSWGSIIGYSDNHTYGFSESEYNNLPESKLVTDLLFQTDPIKVNLGYSWKLPNKDDVEELLRYTRHEFLKFKGVWGFRLTSSNGKYLFFPSSGYIDNGVRYESESKSLLWTSSYCTNKTATSLSLSNNSNSVSISARNIGMQVRGIVNKLKLD